MIGSNRDNYGGMARGVAYVVAYVLLDWLSYVQPTLRLGITPWNPQAGLTLAFLLAFGPRQAPWTFLAACVAELLVRDGADSWRVTFASSAVIAVGYATACIVSRRRGGRVALVSPADATWLIVVAAVTTFAIAATYVMIVVAAGILPQESAVASVARYWVGDLNGVVTLTPLLLLWPRRGKMLPAMRESPALLLAQTGALLVTIWLVFALPSTDELRFFYPLFVPVIWIALHWGLAGALLATLTIQLGIVVAVQYRPDMTPLVDLQYLMVTLGITAWVLGAALTERAGALRRVAAREAEQRALLSAAPDAVVSVDEDGRIISANTAAGLVFGVNEADLPATPLDHLLPGFKLPHVTPRVELAARRADGTPFPADVAWARLEPPARPGYLLIARDVTERRDAETQLQERATELARAMRFAVAGELASALAHELNQPITALVSYLRAAEILAEPLEGQDERLTATLRKAARESIRAADVLRRLRDFYSGGMAAEVDVQMQDVCVDTLARFRERARIAGVRLQLELQPSLPSVRADRTKLEMVLHNLVSNALDSVAASTGPRRVVVSGVLEGPSVLVAVDDDGPGLGGDQTERLFEPFYTTKPDGMGLGLSISRSLLRSQGGDLWYERSALGGARFVTRIPRHAEIHATL